MLEIDVGHDHRFQKDNADGLCFRSSYNRNAKKWSTAGSSANQQAAGRSSQAAQDAAAAGSTKNSFGREANAGDQVWNGKQASSGQVGTNQLLNDKGLLEANGGNLQSQVSHVPTPAARD